MYGENQMKEKLKECLWTSFIVAAIFGGLLEQFPVNITYILYPTLAIHLSFGLYVSKVYKNAISQNNNDDKYQKMTENDTSIRSGA